MSTVSKTHIRLDDCGVAWIDDTNLKVVEIALEHIAHGESPEDIFEQHNRYLSLGQIHAALSHYYDPQSQYDSQIDRQLAETDALRASCLDSPDRRRLRAAGKIS